MKAALRIVTAAALLFSSLQAAEEKWETIFNGKDLTGWTPKIRGYALGEDPNKIFIVEDGVIKVSYANYDDWGDAFGHLFYNKKLSNYRLRLEYRVTGEQVKGGAGWALQNSGIMLHCQDPKTMGKDQNFPVSLEFQLLGARTPTETTANLCTPGTFITIDGKVEKNHCISSKTKAAPVGEWVTAEAEVHGGKLVKHLINGEVAFEYTDTKLDPADADAKPLIDVLGSDALTEGYISLQSESHPYEFRKIEVMELKE